MVRPFGNGEKRSDRGADGRFVKGNKASVGHVPPRKPAEYRRVAIDAIDVERFTKVVHALIEEAIAGNIQAAKLVLEYSLGKPKEMPDFERDEAIDDDYAADVMQRVTEADRRLADLGVTRNRM